MFWLECYYASPRLLGSYCATRPGSMREFIPRTAAPWAAGKGEYADQLARRRNLLP